MVVQAPDSVDLPRDPNSETSMVRREVIVLWVERRQRGYRAMQVGEAELWV
jgi:hypothetical protein